MTKKILIILITLVFISSVWAQNESTVNINGINFEIPPKYQNGEFENNRYRLENQFSIECIDDNIPKHIGLWASEKDYSKDLNIEQHPVRHYFQYNQYIHDNQSHAYFASGTSIYELAWIGNSIPKDIENMIKSTPPSKISDHDFSQKLDNSIKIYKSEKIKKLNDDGEQNYLEAKYHSKIPSDQQDDRQFKEILLTYYK